MGAMVRRVIATHLSAWAAVSASNEATKACGCRPVTSDGIFGRDSLTRLGRRYGFKVEA
jgi:hypothetical protein